MAQKWQETVAGYVDASDYIYVSVVDTDYPVKDNFYEQNEIFTRYGAGAKVAGILGMAAVAAYLVILVFLTIGAGKVKEDEEVYLMKFDHIKTELAAASVLLLWAVVALVGVKAGAFTWQNASGETIYMENVESYLPGIVVGSVEALYTRNVSFRIFESGEKNQGGNGMEEQCAQMAFDLRKRNVPEYPSSVEIYYGICNLLHDPLAYVRIWISGK